MLTAWSRLAGVMRGREGSVLGDCLRIFSYRALRAVSFNLGLQQAKAPGDY